MLGFKDFIEEGKLTDKIKNVAKKEGESIEKHSPKVASNVFTTSMGAMGGLAADPDLSNNPIAAATLGALGVHLIKDRIKRVLATKKPKKIDEAKSPAWQRKEGKNPEGGLNKKGVASYRKQHPGSKLQTAVTTDPSKLKSGSKKAKRRLSFCRRMKGLKNKLTSAKTARDPNSRVNKSLRKWNC